LLRLLTLPDTVQSLLEQGQLSIGHAKALLALPTHRAVSQLATEVVADGLSVRETERRVRSLSAHPASSTDGVTAKRRNPSTPASDETGPELRHIQDTLRRRFQTDVHIQMTAANKGLIKFSFYSADDFNRLLELLAGPPQMGD
jgi:ParB family chromosome partitioning protein